ncbi:MAG: hypothetical protein FWD54_05860 [Endomicrobia bacterium]|nr:hypothetical protein [Endomicrobiia bacterium]MCL2799779.1 hypothetical protein [Endomicrobiia bacterium]
MEKIKKIIGSFKIEKTRKIIGWLLIIYALLIFLSTIYFNILFFLRAKQFGFLDFFFALFKSYPFYNFYIIGILFFIFLLWLGVLFIRKKLNKTLAVIISMSLVILFIQNQFLRRQNIDFMNKSIFIGCNEQ